MLFYKREGRCVMKKWLNYGWLLCCAVFLIGGVVNAEETIKPKKNQMIIINKQINQLAFYEDGELMRVMKVATGKSASLTPEGEFTVIKLIENQPYYKLKIPGGDPRNPLGPRWIGLDVPGTWGYTYGIHGNNAPWTIGTYASAGCVRMYNEEVIWLYDQLELGAKVIITNSSGSFDAIARNKGYYPIDDKAKKTDAKIVVKKDVKAYERPSKYYKSSGVVEAGAHYPLKRYKNWFYVETDSVKGWIKDNSIRELYSVKDVTSFYWQRFEKKAETDKRFAVYLKAFGFQKSIGKDI